MTKFQSSPAPKDGRYLCPATSLTQDTWSFNPRPPRRTGATSDDSARQAATAGFNPRPPRRTGATLQINFKKAYHEVSILARPEGRALQDARRRTFSHLPVSILARPEGRALLAAVGELGFRTSLFQSSPAPKDGRYILQQLFERLNHGFNPRPPRRTGATRRAAYHTLKYIRFNPRPPRRTGAT